MLAHHRRPRLALVEALVRQHLDIRDLEQRAGGIGALDYQVHVQHVKLRLRRRELSAQPLRVLDVPGGGGGVAEVCVHLAALEPHGAARERAADHHLVARGHVTLELASCHL